MDQKFCSFAGLQLGEGHVFLFHSKWPGDLVAADFVSQALILLQDVSDEDPVAGPLGWDGSLNGRRVV